MRRDRDNLASFRIAGFLSSLAGTDLEGAKSPELYDLVVFQAFLHFLKELVNDQMDVIAVETMSLVKILNNGSFGKLIGICHVLRSSTVNSQPEREQLHP